VHVRRTPSDGIYVETGGTARYALPFEWDASGNLLGVLLEWGRTNVFLNSEIGATQSCTVTNTEWTLSFWGTGTITLSGASTAGPLVGTGADDRVSMTFKPSAGTLTLTVSGTCSRVQLELSGYATSWIPTYAATVTRSGDQITIGTDQFSWATACTLMADVVDRAGDTNSGTGLVNTDGLVYVINTNSHAMLFGRSNSSTRDKRFQLLTIKGGSAKALETADNKYASNVPFKVAASFDGATNGRAVKDGVTVLTSTALDAPTVGLTTLQIGTGMHCRAVVVLPVEKSEADMQALTGA
jgi:hypothetical protein